MNFKEGEVCPSCNIGKLVKRNGKWGSFLGCDMFPHTGCQFIGKMDQEDKDDLEMIADNILRENNSSNLILN